MDKKDKTPEEQDLENINAIANACRAMGYPGAFALEIYVRAKPMTSILSYVPMAALIPMIHGHAASILN